MKLLLYIAALCFALCVPAYAQKEWTNWYFGNKAGLVFEFDEPVMLTASAMNTREGCASVSDRNGNLLFYTDGMSVWNRTHEQMPNGFGLLGDTSSSQSALIAAQPGNRNRYYIFTPSRSETASEYGVHYSVVDISAASGGLGDIVTKNVLLLAQSTEKVTAVRHRNNSDVWIIAHEFGTNVFYSYLLTADGVRPTPVRSQVGSVYPQGIGYLKASTDGKRLAAAVDFNLFEVYDFNNATGIVSNALAITTPTAHICYGVEFSPDGHLLYGSKTRDKGSLSQPVEIWQYDLDAGSPEKIRQSAYTVASFPASEASPGALQLGPNGRIYIARAQSRYLSTIDDPNTRGAGCMLTAVGVSLGPGLSEYGLPNFHPAVEVPEFFYSSTCFGDSTYFNIAQDLLPVDSVFWDFGDPAVAPFDTTSSTTGVHLYRAPGTYTVLMSIQRNSVVETFSRDITISAPPRVDLGPDRALCAGTELLLTASTEKLDSYLWSTGEQTASIVVSKPGTYWVRASQDMCAAADTVIVHLQAPAITVSTRASVCLGESVQLSAISSETLLYRWEPPTGLNNPNVAQPVARPTTTTTYTVTATSAIGCTTTASVTVTVTPPFSISLGPMRKLCPGSSTLLDATTTGATYLWSTGETTPVISVGTPGLYSVVVSVGSCSAIGAVEIQHLTANVRTEGNALVCQGSSAKLKATGAASYEWSPTTGLDNPFSAEPIATPQSTTIYRVVGTTNEGCRDTAFATVSVQSSISLDFGLDRIICAGTTTELRSPFPGDHYLWSTGDTTEAIAVREAGVYTLTVMLGTCSATDSVRIYVSTPKVSVEQEFITICKGDSVQLRAEGERLYSWTPTAGLSNPGIANPIAKPDRTTVYTITTKDAINCSSTATVTVEVLDGVPVLLSMPDIQETVGNKVRIPITAEIPADNVPITLRTLSAEVRIPAALFALTSLPPNWTVRRDGNDFVVRIDLSAITLTQPKQEVATVEGTLLLSTQTTASLQFGGIEHDRCVAIATRPGSLAAAGCFLEYRAVRPFIPPSVHIAPNPAGETAQLYLRALGPGTVRIAIYNVEGRCVHEQTQELHSTDETVALPLRDVPAGMYRVAVSGSTGLYTSLMHVVR